MAQGLLTGKFSRGHQFERKDHRSKNRLFHPEHFKRIQEVLPMFRGFAEKRGIQMGQSALAWVLSHPGTCAIAGARNAAQVRQNAKAAEIVLSWDDLAELDRIGRMVTDFLDDDPVLWR
jgi:aryl-alcohol dehydrogenase-like predicted oxidoreductase